MAFSCPSPPFPSQQIRLLKPLVTSTVILSLPLLCIYILIIIIFYLAHALFGKRVNIVFPLFGLLIENCRVFFFLLLCKWLDKVNFFNWNCFKNVIFLYIFVVHSPVKYCSLFKLCYGFCIVSVMNIRTFIKLLIWL